MFQAAQNDFQPVSRRRFDPSACSTSSYWPVRCGATNAGVPHAVVVLA